MILLLDSLSTSAVLLFGSRSVGEDIFTPYLLQLYIIFYL